MGAVIDDAKARSRDLAAIHIAKASLRWDDDTYRDVMQALVGVRSAGELDWSGRKRWLAHLQECVRQAGGQPGRARKPWSPQLRRLWALWQQLADARLVQERTRPALQAWVKRQAGVDQLEWLTPQQIDALLAAGKLWLKRGGPCPGQPG